MAEARRSRLRELLERPDAGPRVRQAVVRLLGVGVITIAVVGALTIWHLVRRGRLIRARLGPPRDVRLPDLTFRSGLRREPIGLGRVSGKRTIDDDDAEAPEDVPDESSPGPGDLPPS
jgi:hypothetical protein